MRFFSLTCLVLIISSCGMTTIDQTKMNGLSYVASPDSISVDHITPVLNVGANFLAIMPFGFIRNLEDPEIIFDTERQWFGETSEGVKQYINELRPHKLKFMLKPQLWVWRGEYTGNIKMSSEEDWKLLESEYEDFILTYAELAEELNVEIFCIGTELDQFIANRKDFWFRLIKSIRLTYSGKLTYASNWDEFKRTPFWSELDYIGIDAYFPVSDSQTPTVQECREGWQPHKKIIEDRSKEYDRKVIFTEFGYRSIDFSGKEPWRSERDLNVLNLESQLNATRALFDEFWNEPWFAGGFVWKWFHNHDRINGNENTGFTPQNKPTEGLIKLTYEKYR